ncbi:MAG: metallophosphoesterase [Methanobacterium sp.]|nr:metallophosphoesterase [Methanobacterium sp.]
MRTFNKILVLIIFTAFIIGCYMFIEPYWIETKEITIESDQIPENFDGKKIVFISDIHAGPLFSQQRVNDLVNQVNNLHPDLILLGGDYVSGEDEYVNSTFESLSKLNATYGVYAVLGNSDPQFTTWEALNNSPINDIGNMGTWIGDSQGEIRLGGIGAGNDRQDYEDVTEDASSRDFVIMLSHDPDYFEEVDKSMVDLVLSGHTHGGQVTFFGLYAPYLPSKYGQKYRTGVIKEVNSTLIISNGIGTVNFPVRFFARPQIIVINLKRT